VTKRKGYMTRTGPTLSDKVALRLSEAGLQRVWAGTEKVYFVLPHSRPDTTEEAQAALLEVFPDAGFKVEYTYVHAHWAVD
jgi:hypothetical protein